MNDLNRLASLSYMSTISCDSQLPSRLYLFAIFALSLAYGWVLAGLPLEVFKDRANYLIYADQSSLIFLHYWSHSILTGLTNEPIWLLLNAGLALVFEPETTLRIVVGVPASIVAYLVLRAEPRCFIWLLFFLFLPQVLKNHIVHLRQGVAVSFFLIGWFANWRAMRWFFFLCTPFIHASFFFILTLLLLTNFFRKLRLSAGLQNILFIFVGLTLSIFLAVVAKFLGARQAAEYDFVVADVSGLGFVFWLMVLFVMISQGRTFMRQHAFAMGALFFYLSTYFFIEVSARIFESALIILLFAGLQMTVWRRQVFVVLVVGYGLLSYMLSINQSWLGFGVV